MQDDNELLDLSSSLKTRPVKMDGTDMLLTELTGLQRDRYLDLSAKRVKMQTDDKGIVSGTMRDFVNHEAELLTLCLSTVTDSKPVPMATIQKWPASVVSKLTKAARVLSGLATNVAEKKAVEDEAKNDSPGKEGSGSS